MNCLYSKCVLILSLIWALAAQGQTGASLRGQVTDPSGAVVPDATVVMRTGTTELRQQTNAEGRYTFAAVPPGSYTVRMTKTGFAPFEVESYEVAGAVTLDAQLVVAMEAQQVTVQEDTRGVSVDPDSNAGALVLRGADLEALSDDPDQLAQDLQALAGPAAGPNGGQIFVDGFSGGRLPPKSAIREIRINQNPFSAEHDRLGFGRIEILTKPGSDRFRGQIMANFSDNVLNARNPFLTERSPWQSRMLMASAGGPLSKKSSFNVDIEHRNVRENAVIRAQTLDTSLRPIDISDALVTPQVRTGFHPRVDYQLTPNNTLVLRYGYTRISEDNQGVGQFSLASRAYDARSNDHTFQLTETAILGARAVNETRFQYMRTSSLQNGDNAMPAIQVLDAFTGGGAQIGLSSTGQNRWEVQNITTITAGTHTWKFGGRLRGVSLTDVSPQNFGGTFTFAGGPGPVLDDTGQVVAGADGLPAVVQLSSLERYRRTLLLQSLGFSPSQIRASGGGATLFTMSAGNPLASVSQIDAGVFLLDDWRVKPNFTLSLGLRYETQTNVSDWTNFSPRVSFAWAVDGGSNRSARTVVRGGAGVFYDRIGESLTLQALRFNGVSQQQFRVSNPDFYPAVPSVEELAADRIDTATRALDGSIRAPYIMQTAMGVDRQLPWSTSVSINYVFSRGVHMLRTRNINAPFEGVRPYGDTGNIYQYESTGTMRQNQLMFNANTRANRWFSLFGFYVLNYANGDTDGANSLPANPYDLTGEWGPNSFDVRHRVFVGGMVNAPWRVSFSPFFTANSGQPFNILSGIDLNGDTELNDRPSFASDLTLPGVSLTDWGPFNRIPLAGEQIIPRNYGRGPGQVSLNVRLSRTWGFGSRGESGMGTESGPPAGMRGGPGGGGPGGGGPPMAGAMRGGPGGPGGGPGGMFGGAQTGKRFNLTLSLMARNLLNHVNLAAPVGNLTSPFFGQSTALAGGFGPMGGSAASNRRIDVQLRLTF